MNGDAQAIQGARNLLELNMEQRRLLKTASPLSNLREYKLPKRDPAVVSIVEKKRIFAPQKSRCYAFPISFKSLSEEARYQETQALISELKTSSAKRPGNLHFAIDV